MLFLWWTEVSDYWRKPHRARSSDKNPAALGEADRDFVSSLSFEHLAVHVLGQEHKTLHQIWVKREIFTYCGECSVGNMSPGIL